MGDNEGVGLESHLEYAVLENGDIGVGNVINLVREVSNSAYGSLLQSFPDQNSIWNWDTVFKRGGASLT